MHILRRIQMSLRIKSQGSSEPWKPGGESYARSRHTRLGQVVQDKAVLRHHKEDEELAENIPINPRLLDHDQQPKGLTTHGHR